MSISFGARVPPCKDFIPLCKPNLSGRELAYIRECIETGWISCMGPFVTKFENMIAAYSGAAHAAAVTTGSTAIHLALTVRGIQRGEEVVLPSLTFIAPANAVRHAGAWPVLIDVEPTYWQMNPEKLEAFVEKDCRWKKGRLVNMATGRTVRAIMPVHVLGHPVDMDPIMAVAEKYDLFVIEDAAQSLGARYKERNIGQLGDMACTSFNANKIITTGGGGMIMTDNAAWDQRIRYLSTQAKDNEVEYIHHGVGYNCRMTNIAAAIGCAQMDRMDADISCKRKIADVYTRALQHLPGVTCAREAPWASSTFWIYTILVDESEAGISSRRIQDHLFKKAIQSRPLWQPLHLSPAHRRSYRQACPVAEKLYRDAVCLPSYAALSEEHQKKVIAAVREAIGSGCVNA